MSPRGEVLNVLNDVGRLPLLSEGGGHYSKYRKSGILLVQNISNYKGFYWKQTLCLFFAYIAGLFWYSHLFQVLFRLAMQKVQDILEERPHAVCYIVLSDSNTNPPPPLSWYISCLSLGLTFLCVAGKQVHSAHGSWWKGGWKDDKNNKRFFCG